MGVVHTEQTPNPSAVPNDEWQSERGSIWLELDCEWAVSNAEMLLILQKKVKTINRFNQL